MNITHIQALAAPVLAPVAPAVLFGNNLFHGLSADGVNSSFALVAAVAGTVGVEISGALACTMAVMAYHKRDTRIMWISIISALVYAWFVYSGISSAQNSAAFAGAVVISLIAYLMLGVYQSYQSRLDTAREEADVKISVLEAQRKLTNAETRRAKSENIERPTAVQRLSTGGRYQVDQAMIDKLNYYWMDNPSASLRQAAQACGCSPSTAGKYKNNAIV